MELLKQYINCARCKWNVPTLLSFTGKQKGKSLKRIQSWKVLLYASVIFLEKFLTLMSSLCKSLFWWTEKQIRELHQVLCKCWILSNLKTVLSLCLTKYYAMKTYWGNGSIAPRIHILGTRWRWVVSFKPRPLYPQGTNPWHNQDGRIPKASRTQWRGEKFPAPAENRSPLVQPAV
jgi:hypothetical protein